MDSEVGWLVLVLGCVGNLQALVKHCNSGTNREWNSYPSRGSLLPAWFLSRRTDSCNTFSEDLCCFSKCMASYDPTLVVAYMRTTSWIRWTPCFHGFWTLVGTVVSPLVQGLGWNWIHVNYFQATWLLLPFDTQGHVQLMLSLIFDPQRIWVCIPFPEFTFCKCFMFWYERMGNGIIIVKSFHRCSHWFRAVEWT